MVLSRKRTYRGYGELDALQDPETFTEPSQRQLSVQYCLNWVRHVGTVTKNQRLAVMYSPKPRASP
jgi:hypothetical protein